MPHGEQQVGTAISLMTRGPSALAEDVHIPGLEAASAAAADGPTWHVTLNPGCSSPHSRAPLSISSLFHTWGGGPFSPGLRPAALLFGLS